MVKSHVLDGQSSYLDVETLFGRLLQWLKPIINHQLSGLKHE
jgi:hypothetical protein